jgi:hypothetical protein
MKYPMQKDKTKIAIPNSVSNSVCLTSITITFLEIAVNAISRIILTFRRIFSLSPLNVSKISNAIMILKNKGTPDSAIDLLSRIEALQTSV